MKNQEYFDKSEEVCLQLFKSFNDGAIHLLNTGATPYAYDFDVSGQSSSRLFAIELKRRLLRLSDDMKSMIDSKNGNTYEDLMIESHKLAELIVTHITASTVPLYVNFLDNAVIVYNLSKLSSVRKNRTKIKSNGYGAFEVGTRFFLSLDDCWIYQNNKLVKSPKNT